MTYKGIKREDTCGLAFDSRRSHASKRNDNEASAATKCLHFGMVEPKGVALAQQVRDDSRASPYNTFSRKFGVFERFFACLLCNL